METKEGWRTHCHCLFLLVLLSIFPRWSWCLEFRGAGLVDRTVWGTLWAIMTHSQILGITFTCSWNACKSLSPFRSRYAGWGYAFLIFCYCCLECQERQPATFFSVVRTRTGVVAVCQHWQWLPLICSPEGFLCSPGNVICQILEKEDLLFFPLGAEVSLMAD